MDKSHKSKAQSDRDMAENQVVFRGWNEKVQKNIQEVNETVERQGARRVSMKGGEYLHFYCECSDENCEQRIKVTFVEYKKIHSDRGTFVVKPNHVVSHIEKVTHKGQEFWVVKKNKYPSQITTELKSTGLEHL